MFKTLKTRRKNKKKNEGRQNKKNKDRSWKNKDRLCMCAMFVTRDFDNCLNLLFEKLVRLC